MGVVSPAWREVAMLRLAIMVVLGIFWDRRNIDSEGKDGDEKHHWK